MQNFQQIYPFLAHSGRILPTFDNFHFYQAHFELCGRHFGQLAPLSTHTHTTTAPLGDKKTSIGEVGKTSQTGPGIPRTEEGLTRHTEHFKLEDNE